MGVSMTTQSDLANPRLTTPLSTPPRDVKGGSDGGCHQ